MKGLMTTGWENFPQRKLLKPYLFESNLDSIYYRMCLTHEIHKPTL